MNGNGTSRLADEPYDNGARRRKPTRLIWGFG